MTLGIIDVGTNSIHLLIGVLGITGKFHVILKERDLTRLGEGGLARDRLTRASMTRAMGVLRRYAAMLKRCGVDHVEAVATSAVREAKNGPEFVRQVRAKLGIPLRIVSGKEEARLIYLGVVQAHHLKGEILVITIGGGSAQVIQANGAHVKYVTSVQLGCARLSQLFIRHDPPLPEEMAALRAHIARVWSSVARSLRPGKTQQVLASSATIAQVMMAAYILAHGGPPKTKERIQVGPRELQDLAAQLSRTSADERIRFPGLDPRREDLALPTVLVLLGWMEAAGVKRVRYAPGSLREGLVMDYLIRHHLGQTKPIEHPLEALWSNGDGMLWVGKERNRIAKRSARA